MLDNVVVHLAMVKVRMHWICTNISLDMAGGRGAGGGSGRGGLLYLVTVFMLLCLLCFPSCSLVSECLATSRSTTGCQSDIRHHRCRGRGHVRSRCVCW